MERSLDGKNQGQILSSMEQTKKVNKKFIIRFLVPPFIAFNELFSS